ncbi:putative leucine rich repeat and sterile alpha motif containing 1 [Fasciola hepatica]|uniref:Leucine rich repeat and sterile alpha motif containing 1 n=1 Tax=Fasciola hepatica TaxID=6192 RepID=A0A4E0QZW1_FASHE|nr:putative leucine rich repeat and sterile alpha motif containing 1 [Fasciola hepatica]
MCTLLDAEQSASHLIQKLLAERVKTRLMEVADNLASQQLLESPDTSFKLRREETLAAMERMLVREDEVYRDQASRRDTVARHALSVESVDSAHVDRVLARRDKDRKKLSDELASKEEAQREAFAKLFAQQDRQAQRLKHDIHLIEQELCLLTMAEQSRRSERTKNNQRTLSARRTELLELLIQLSRDQKKRQNELQQQLIEMEKRKQQDQLDYWLIQYQRVLDHKPPELANEVDGDVFHVLKAADSLDYLPNFRYHHITSAQLDGLTDEELQRIGVHAVGLRSAILNQIATRATKQMNYPDEFDPVKQASAPPEDLVINRRPVPPTAPKTVTAQVENECCVCQNSTCNIVFLQCAHVCTCQVCAERLTVCPLCRAPIQQRLHLQCY